MSLDLFAKKKAEEIKAQTQWRSFKAQASDPDTISFCHNDYLGLAHDPRMIEASRQATQEFGTGSTGSRLISGNHSLYGELEEELAHFKGSDSALVFGSGFLANSGTIPVFAGPEDLILADELIHASMHAGIKLSRATTYFFPHNDTQQIETLLKEYRSKYRHVLLLTEGVFSMDGDRAPLSELVRIAGNYDSWLMVDDAHGVGVLGNGRGSVHEAGLDGQIPLIVGTCSKALGSYGGYVTGSRSATDIIRNRARSMIFTTGLPPGVIAATRKAIEIIQKEPERTKRPLELAQRFTKSLELPMAQSAVVPIILGAEKTALEASDDLARQGIQVTAIRPPTVAPGKSRLRISFSACHSDGHIEILIHSIRTLLNELK